MIADKKEFTFEVIMLLALLYLGDKQLKKLETRVKDLEYHVSELEYQVDSHRP